MSTTDTSHKACGAGRQPLGNHFMNFKSYNLFMADVVSLRELVDELKVITDEHHVFLNKATGKTVTLTDEDISAVESGDDTDVP